jgi:hypothetical protein
VSCHLQDELSGTSINFFSTCWRNLQKHALFVCRIVFSCFSVNFPFTCPSPTNTVLFSPLYKEDVTLFTPRAKIRDHPENKGMYRQSDTCCHNMNTNYFNCIMLTANSLVRTVTCDYNIAIVAIFVVDAQWSCIELYL